MSMTESWLERWQEGRIGWHEPDGNGSLKKHWQATGRRVLVPLCGKAVDLTWLARLGNEVVGIELAEIAVEAFFSEQGIAFDVVRDTQPVYTARELPITIYCGDLFEITGLECNAHYDRGALVAMPAHLRGQYASHVDSLLLPGAEHFVITVEYDQSVTAGPPFSIQKEELLSYWPSLRCADAYQDIDNGPPKFRQAGLKSMLESVWVSSG
jgi:thiopurine S-methyltransferase